MATELKLTGVDELLTDLARLAPDLAAAARTQQQAAAADAVEAIRAALPFVTGTLRASVQAQKEPSQSPVRVFTRISVTAPYAHFVEFGTARTVPHPVFAPAQRRAREAFVKEVIANIRAQGLTVSGE